MMDPATPQTRMMELVEADMGYDASARGAFEATPGRRRASLSDAGQTPQRVSLVNQTSKDDSAVDDRLAAKLAAFTTTVPPTAPLLDALPVTPSRLDTNHSGSLHPRGSAQWVAQQSNANHDIYAKPSIPASPSLDQSLTYASPTSTVPRRSRGLDFSRAATSLHHSTLADTSPEMSPITANRPRSNAMYENAPGGRIQSSTSIDPSIWSMMGSQERRNVASSVGSSATHKMMTDFSSSSDDDDAMDEDMTDDAYMMTPQAAISGLSHMNGAVGVGGSPSITANPAFLQRQRPRRHSQRRSRAPPMFAHQNTAGRNTKSRSPPLGAHGFTPMNRDMQAPHSRRESISWAANQLAISGSESEDSPRPVDMDEVLGPNADGQNRVVRRAVTRRSNMLPKTKTFARIKAALMEEGAPVEAEVMHEAEVVRQVRESDVEPHPSRRQPSLSAITTGQSSPALTMNESMDDVPADDALSLEPSGLGLTGTFKQPAQKNWKGRALWEKFAEANNNAASRITPPPPVVPHESSSGMSIEDMSMDSPSIISGSQNAFAFLTTATSSSGGDTPQYDPNSATGRRTSSFSQSGGQGVPPSAAEITRRINNKRRRDDDLDPVAFKRRAVSPGLSVSGSPIMQSPMQHTPWGGGSRPGSNSGDRPCNNNATNTNSNGNMSSAASDCGSVTMSEKRLSMGGGFKGRIGFQGMADTNDGITKLSID